MFNAHDRRTFVSALGALVTGLVGAGEARIEAQGAETPGAKIDFDLSWLDQLKGKHKQLYDLGGHDLAVDPAALRFARNYLDTFRDVFTLETPDINTAVGISRIAFPMNASDRLWEKYRLGERARIIDPKTKQPAVRNIFYEGSEISIKTLQARGTVFWQCNVALGGMARQLADANQLKVKDVHADLIAGLNPGVRLMPSHVMALGLTQERGFTYMKP